MVEGHRRFSVSEQSGSATTSPSSSRPGSRSRLTTRRSTPRPKSRVASTSRCRPARASTRHISSPNLKYNSVHILQPDPSTMGGILRTRMVCAMADANYAVVAPHQAQGPIATAVCVQIGACTELSRTRTVRRVQRRLGARDRHSSRAASTDGFRFPTLRVSASTSTQRRKSTPIRSRISSPSFHQAGNAARAPGPTSPPATKRPERGGRHGNVSHFMAASRSW